VSSTAEHSFTEEDNLGLLRFLNKQEELKVLSLQNISNLFVISNDQWQDLRLEANFELKNLFLKNLPKAELYRVMELMNGIQDCERITIGLDVIPAAYFYLTDNGMNLGSITLDVQLLPMSEVKPTKSSKLPQLIELTLEGSIQGMPVEDLLQFFHRHPDIMRLDLGKVSGISSDDDRFWRNLCSILQQLKFLKVAQLNSRNLLSIKSSNLQTLAAMRVDKISAIDWDEFSKNNRSIEKFQLGNSDSKSLPLPMPKVVLKEV